MSTRVVSRLAGAGAVLALVACGSSPTEPTFSSSGPQTTLRLVVTKCDLGGSVTVNTELGVLGSLQTPGEATFYLPPGPHNLWWQRGNEAFGGSILNGAGDPVGAIPPGGTASIMLADPQGACTAMPHGAGWPTQTRRDLAHSRRPQTTS